MILNWSTTVNLTEQGVLLTPEVPGVYRLGYIGSDGKGYIYYVGQAENLRSRLSDHLINREENPCCAGLLRSSNCYFRVAAVNNQTDRDAIEAALYNKYLPHCCERVPTIFPADINFG